MNWDIERARVFITDLLRNGLPVAHKRIAVYEVFGAPKGCLPFNVLSIVVLEDQVGAAEDSVPKMLTSERIRVDGFPGWTFGVARSFRNIEHLDEALVAFENGQCWALSGKPIKMGPLEVMSPMFVPPDGTVEVPINRLLKNNFWNGSHVIRLCDPTKDALLPFLEDRRRLQLLSQAISAHMPVALSGLVDFLGDVLIQIPVAGMIADVGTPKNGSLEVAVAWRDNSRSRRLTATVRARSDTALTGAAVSMPFRHSVSLPIASDSDPIEAEIWDQETGVLLAATAPTSSLSQITVNQRLLEPEPRVFTIRDAAGVEIQARVALISELQPIVVGTSRETSADRWHLRRSDLDESRRLEESRDFVQYRPKGDGNAERARALADIRFLINTHGAAGVDLWDPYLSAEDLLQTLFWSPTSDAPLRAITDGRSPPKSSLPISTSETDQVQPLKSFAEQQRDTLICDGGNRQRLRLEFRMRIGPEGWAFHDRFLIFPNLPEGPAAWSLGTSVNHLGKAHHILQKVSNATLVAGAFEDLWTELREPSHLVWRSW